MNRGVNRYQYSTAENGTLEAWVMTIPPAEASFTRDSLALGLEGAFGDMAAQIVDSGDITAFRCEYNIANLTSLHCRLEAPSMHVIGCTRGNADLVMNNTTRLPLSVGRFYLLAQHADDLVFHFSRKGMFCVYDILLWPGSATATEIAASFSIGDFISPIKRPGAVSLLGEGGWMTEEITRNFISFFNTPTVAPLTDHYFNNQAKILVGNCLWQQTGKDRIGLSTRRLKNVWETVELLRYNLGQPHTVHSLAAHLQSDTAELEADFKKLMNATIAEFLMVSRMVDARERIATTEEPITAIAESLGYNSYPLFLRDFEEVMGIHAETVRDSFIHDN